MGVYDFKHPAFNIDNCYFDRFRRLAKILILKILHAFLW